MEANYKQSLRNIPGNHMVGIVRTYCHTFGCETVPPPLCAAAAEETSAITSNCKKKRPFVSANPSFFRGNSPLSLQLLWGILEEVGISIAIRYRGPLSVCRTISTNKICGAAPAAA